MGAVDKAGRDAVEERPFTAQGFRSRVLETGPGASDEAVVFIHGAPGSAADWRPLLAETGAIARALAFDLPGFGSASRPSHWDYSPDALATFVAAALSELRVTRAHLVLSDLGGAAGLHWAAAHPDTWASAVLINTGILIGYRWHLPARLNRMPIVGAAVAAGGRIGLRDALRLYGCNVPEHAIARWRRDFDWASRRALLRFYRATPAADFSRLAPEMSRRARPVLVLWGERDRFVPAEQADRQREAFPNAEIEILEGVGHYGHVEAPELIAERVLPFLRRQRSGAATEGG
jgi:pimeloyl-ACP methyl ester carboxylesterase